MLVANQPNQSQTIMKAFTTACVDLDMSTTDRARMIGVNASTLSRNQQTGFSIDSKTAELQLNFIRLYRSLFAVAGGDHDFMKHWFRTKNKALNGVPAELCQSILGLIRTNQYLDAMRGKV